MNPDKKNFNHDIEMFKPYILGTNQKYCASQQGDCKHIGYCDPNATCKKKANVGKFRQYWQCECNKGWSGNGIQCMDSNGTLSALPGEQVEVTLTMTDEE